MTKGLLYFFLLLSAIHPRTLLARDIEPFVSTDWLENNLGLPGLLIIDVRSAAEYKKNHIPGALNAAVNAWTVNKNGLLRELPDFSELTALMSTLGVRENSKVVIIGNGITDFDRGDAIRVAWTVLTAGIRNVSVLDGGYGKWIKDKKSTASEKSIAAAAGEYKGRFNEAVMVSKKYVLRKIGKSILVDTRTPDIYFGIATESWAQKPGHIEGAVNLPTPWLFTKEGILRSRSELESMARGVIGTNKSKEYIIYCGVGPYAMVWSYIMTEMLGYRDVKIFDGSMQEWVMDPVGPISIFTWR
jgi:thiosulfate/3-mercaptopyruvate sulfurtransferase